MLFARGSDALLLVAGWGSAGISVGLFVWDGVTPDEEFLGRVALGFAIVTASIFVGTQQARAVRAATNELTACVDKTIGAAARFGAASANRRHDDRAELASVRPFVPRNKGGKR